MGQFKNVGDPFLALAEECGEVIQVIAKKYRFNGDWNEIPEGRTISRLDELKNEMDDLIYQWNSACQQLQRCELGFLNHNQI